MKETIIADSTCLIGLERINHLHILQKLYDNVIIPPEVEKESGILKDWIKVEQPHNSLLVYSLKLILDSGEAEAIALACMKGKRIILDDKQARNVARRMKLNVIGTVGMLLQAKNSGIIKAVKPLIEELERNSFYIGEPLKREALKIAKE
ncbi:DUF3368 domain-containing protein [Desulfonema magnum]|uniref:DUF3368 n=1 Tax=Desulfonema magnum TaxID=45655 RepID=A0A975GKP8_9BACT|nr:DUF3368 domain-containing protein [Desulfonema magnum]QTA84971.1 DUF3368 [Desulfonema magnum]